MIGTSAERRKLFEGSNNNTVWFVIVQEVTMESLRHWPRPLLLNYGLYVYPLNEISTRRQSCALLMTGPKPNPKKYYMVKQPGVFQKGYPGTIRPRKAYDTNVLQTRHELR